MSEIGSWLAIGVDGEGSVALEWHSHLAEEGPALFVRTGSGHDGDVHAPDRIDLVEGNFRENDLFPHPEGVVAASVKAFGAHPAEVPNSRQCKVDQALEEGVHPITAKKTTRLISEKFRSIEIKTTFQSRFGPQEWLQPYTDKTLESLPKEGKKNVLLISPGFSSDCVETLEEILIQGKESFINSGGENFDMVLPRKPATTNQKVAPGPPIEITIATPAIFPIPTVPETAVDKAWK